ncbi:MAG: SDR family oxidoreductase [Bacillota bacterium]
MKSVLANTPIKRVAEPEEVARIALFLATDASAMVTGQAIVMDGGGSL